MADEAPVRFDLRFTRAAQTNTASRLLEVGPHPGQPRQHVLELRELHLHFRLARPRARGEDVEDDLGSIHHAGSELELDVLSLRRRELVVEDDQRGREVGDAVSKLFQLSLAEVRRRARPIEQLSDLADDLRPCRIREARQLFEMFSRDDADPPSA